MAILKCSVSSCVHNEENMCCRSAIDVVGKDAERSEATCCGSYDKRGCGCTNEIKHPDSLTDIRCEAVKCMYNDNEKCTAGQIGVSGSNAHDMKQTECSTFKCNCN